MRKDRRSTRNIKPPSRELTRREGEVVNLLADGADTQQIYETMNIGKDTLQAHLKKIYDKTGMDTRLQVAVKVLRERHAREIADLSTQCDEVGQ